MNLIQLKNVSKTVFKKCIEKNVKCKNEKNIEKNMYTKQKFIKQRNIGVMDS